LLLAVSWPLKSPENIFGRSDGGLLRFRKPDLRRGKVEMAGCHIISVNKLPDRALSQEFGPALKAAIEERSSP
jgi:hypothetical protein